MEEAATITTCMPISVLSIAVAVATTSVLTPHVLVITQLLITLPVHQGTREWIMGAMTTTVATIMASTIVVEAMTTIAAEATTTIAAILEAVPTKAEAMVAATTTAIVAEATTAEVATIAVRTPSPATAVARCVSRRAADRNAFRAAQCVAPAALPVPQAHLTSAAAVRIVEAAALTAVVRVVAPTEVVRARMVVDIKDAKTKLYGNRQDIHQYTGG